jgi:hypothetical protein
VGPFAAGIALFRCGVGQCRNASGPADARACCAATANAAFERPGIVVFVRHTSRIRRRSCDDRNDTSFRGRSTASTTVA